MTAVAQKLMTVEEFVAWAEKRPEKHWELFEGVPEIQQAQNWGHARHVYRIARVIENTIEASGLALFFGIEGIVVKAGPNMAFEPDLVVFAGAMADRDIIVPEPLIVVEVLSPSTARKDLTVKLSGYFNVPSIQHYLIADWEERELIHYRREGTAIAPPLILSDGTLRLDPPGLEITLADVFK